MQPSFLLLHVDSPAAAGAFYGRLLGAEPVETSPTFVLFALDGGLKLGLWSRHTVAPPPDGAGASTELGIVVESPAEVDATWRRWGDDGVAILQEPTDMDFGRTFVGEDADGHRLRVFAPG